MLCYRLILFLTCLDECPSLQINPDKLQTINELVDKSVALVILGYSNVARAILANELLGGKPLFPVVTALQYFSCSFTLPKCLLHEL